MQTSCVAVCSGCVHALGMLARSCSAQAGMGMRTQRIGCTSMDMGRQVCQISMWVRIVESAPATPGSGAARCKQTRAHGKTHLAIQARASLTLAGTSALAATLTQALCAQTEGRGSPSKSTGGQQRGSRKRCMHACALLLLLLLAADRTTIGHAPSVLCCRHRPSPCCCRIARVTVPRPWTASLRA